VADDDKDTKARRDEVKGVIKEAFDEWYAAKEKERKDKEGDKKPGFLDSLLGK
jgi:hypothetical protein